MPEGGLDGYEDETADVLRRRLFDEVDRTAADAVVAAYSGVWNRNQVDLPASVLRPEIRDLFRRGYPLHPETLSVLTEKLSSLSTFQRTRGMLRLLARTVHVLWRDKPADALAILRPDPERDHDPTGPGGIYAGPQSRRCRGREG